MVLDLDSDLAQFRDGRTAAEGYIPSVVAFTAEESVVEGVLDVTRGDTLRVYYGGSGEPDIAESDPDSPEGYGQFAEGPAARVRAPALERHRRDRGAVRLRGAARARARRLMAGRAVRRGD